MKARGPRLAIAVVVLASRLVPRSARHGWRLEWEGELHGRWAELAARADLNLRSRLDLLLRASGSLVDALFYKDGGWTMEGLVQDVSIAIGVVETRDGFLAQSLSAKSFRTGLMTAFALAALLLAVLGIAGVMAYSVSRRTCEMGVRLSLGAEPTDVRGLVLREGVRPIFIGVALGVTVALAFARVLTTLVFEVGVRDPGVYLAVASFLTVATLTACYVPANRASRIDPVLALLSE